jgi:hypothetical protein
MAGSSHSEAAATLFLCAAGIYADHRLYGLRRGVWEWFGLNVDEPHACLICELRERGAYGDGT